MNMKKLLVSALVLGFALTACSSTTTTTTTDDGGDAMTDGDVTVKVVDSMFEPADLAIAAGTSVTFMWVETEQPHNVVANDDSFTSGDLTTEGSYVHVFEDAGTFEYYCLAHRTTGMTGTITVS